MTTRELAARLRSHQGDMRHQVYLRHLYESGRINEWMRVDQDGERVPDPLAVRAARMRLLLARAPVRAEVGR